MAVAVIGCMGEKLGLGRGGRLTEEAAEGETTVPETGRKAGFEGRGVQLRPSEPLARQNLEVPHVCIYGISMILVPPQKGGRV